MSGSGWDILSQISHLEDKYRDLDAFYALHCNCQGKKKIEVALCALYSSLNPEDKINVQFSLSIMQEKKEFPDILETLIIKCYVLTKYIYKQVAGAGFGGPLWG